MTDITEDEARVLWFVSSMEGGPADLKKLIVPQLHPAVDSAIAKGFLAQVWAVTEAGQEASDQAWREHEKQNAERLRGFKI